VLGVQLGKRKGNNMKSVSDNELIDTSRGKKRIGALFDENAMLRAVNADLLAALESLLRVCEAELDINRVPEMFNAISAIKQAKGE